MNLVNFCKWWEKRLTLSLGFLVVTHWLQIPHFIWGGDLLLDSGFVSRIHPVLDFFLYSIDLIEIPAIIAVTMSFISRIVLKRKRTKQKL